MALRWHDAGDRSGRSRRLADRGAGVQRLPRRGSRLSPASRSRLRDAAELLEGYGVVDIDAVFVTHGHPDHCADLSPLLRARVFGTTSTEALSLYARRFARCRSRPRRSIMLKDAYDLNAVAGEDVLRGWTVSRADGDASALRSQCRCSGLDRRYCAAVIGTEDARARHQTTLILESSLRETRPCDA
jgi:ribonuclease BN (tRNA processing enzyme)